MAEDGQTTRNTNQSNNTYESNQANTKGNYNNIDNVSSQPKVHFIDHESERQGDSDHGSNRTLTQISTPPNEAGSVYSNTMTSGITGTDTTSEWNSRLSIITADSSGSESDWWEDSRDSRRFREHDNDDEHDVDDDDFDGDYYDDDDDNSYNYVRLNLENEDMPDDKLREHRLTQHLKSIERLNNERSDLVETVVTATGRRLGRKDKGAIINETFNEMGGVSILVETFIFTYTKVLANGHERIYLCSCCTITLFVLVTLN